MMSEPQQPAAATPLAATVDEWMTGRLDLAAYLRRIGHDADLAPTAQTLAGLHREHVAAIPFENADIMLGRGVAVDLASIQDKLVHRRTSCCECERAARPGWPTPASGPG
jgi:hypothetical protein